MSATPNERDTLRADNEWLRARVEELERQLADAIPLDAFKVPTDVLTADDPPDTASVAQSVKENETHG